MSPSVLGLGVPASSSLIIGDDRKKAVEDGVNRMNADMKSSPYEWEFFDFTPDVGFEALSAKLKERKWDVVLVGMGLRIMPGLVPFFQQIINTVRKELPDARFAFNGSFDDTQEACKRALGEKS